MAELNRVQFVIPLPAAPEHVEHFARAVMEGYQPTAAPVRVVLLYLLNDGMPESLCPGAILARLTGIVYQAPPKNGAVHVHHLEDFHLPAEVLVDVCTEEKES